MRLNQYLAASTKLARRTADAAIATGRVSVNDRPAQLGQLITDSDVVTLDGQVVKPAPIKVVAFHKPAGYVCSRRQQGTARTIYSILPRQYHDLETIGRLDKDSSGLLVLTNDGELAQRLSHPKHEKTKVYLVATNPTASDTVLTRLNAGVQLTDGLSKLSVRRHGKLLEVTMSEGRNRQVRRSLEAVGLAVTTLERQRFGKLSLGKLKPGESREIAREAVE